MSNTPEPALEGIVGEAVRGFMQARRRPAALEAVVRLPLAIRSDEDLVVLVRWFRLLCASEALRERFLSGAIELEPNLVGPPVPLPAAAAGARGCSLSMVLDEAVVTESVLRRYRAAGQVVLLRRSAVITPAARDYARTAGIRMERSE